MSTTNGLVILSTAREALSRSYDGRFGAMIVSQVDPAIFSLRFFADCMSCTFCHDSCCHRGCDADLENIERLTGQSNAALAEYIGSPQDGWFSNEIHRDDEMPGGGYKESTVVDGSCIFRNQRGRGCGIHTWCLQQGFDYHEIKPILCWLFPLTIDAGALIPQNVVLNKTLICVDQGQTLYRSQRAEVLYLFGPELVAELDTLEQQVLSGQIA